MEEIKIDRGDSTDVNLDYAEINAKDEQTEVRVIYFEDEIRERVTNLEIEIKALREIVQDQIELMKKLIDNKVPLYSGSRWIDKDLTNEGLGRDMPSMVGDKKDLKPEWTKGNSWGDWAERFKKNKDE